MKSTLIRMTSWRRSWWPASLPKEASWWPRIPMRPQPQIQVSWRSFTSEDLTVEQPLDIFFVHLTVPSRSDRLDIFNLFAERKNASFLTKVQYKTISELSWSHLAEQLIHFLLKCGWDSNTTSHQFGLAQDKIIASFDCFLTTKIMAE